MHETLQRQVRQHRLRTAEIVGITTTAAAFAVTILLVSTGAAQELNPWVLALLDTAGWAAAGVVGIAFEAAAFWYLRRHHGKGEREVSLFRWSFGTVHVGRLVRRGGWAVALVGVGDLLVNAYWLAQTGLPESVRVAVYGPPVALVAGGAALELAWPLVRRAPRPSPQVAGAVAFAVVLVVSSPGFAAVSQSSAPAATTTQLSAAGSGSGTVVDDFEGGLSSTWTATGSWSHTTTEAVEGSGAALAGSDTNPLEKTDVGAKTPTSFTYWFHTDNQNGGYVRMNLEDDGSGCSNSGCDITQVEVDSNRNVNVRSSGSWSDTGIDLASDTWYKIKVENIDYSNDQYDLTIEDKDGNSVGSTTDTAFEESASNLDHIGFLAFNDPTAYVDYTGYGGISISSTPDLSGTVEDQDGTAVPGADVVLLTEYENNTGDRLRDVREQLQNTEAPTFEKDLSLTGSDGQFTEAVDTYAAVHTTEDWKTEITQDRDDGLAAVGANPDLSSPGVVYSTEDELVIHLRDGTNTPLIQDDVDDELPGTTTSGEIVVERLDAANGTLSSFSPNTSDYVQTRWGGETVGTERKTHEAVEVGTLPTGYYRVYPASNPGASYTFAVAPKNKLSNMDQQPWVQDLNTTEGEVEERARELANLTGQDGIAIHHTTADSDGNWNYSFSNPVREVDIMAMKKPSTMQASDYDGDYATYGEITTYINDTIAAAREDSSDDPSDAICNGAADDTGTVYLADGRVTAEPVESNITVPTRSASATPDVAPLNRLCLEEDVRNLLENSSLSDLAGLLDLEDMSTEELRNWLRDLQRGIIDENEQACKRYLRAAGATDVSDCERDDVADDDDTTIGTTPTGTTPIYTDPGDYNASELRDRIGDLEEALDETSDTVDDGELRACQPGGTDADNPGTCPSTPDAGSNNVTWVYDTGLEDVQPDEVSVRIQFSNGSTRVTTANRSEHIRIEDQTIGSDVVVVEDYPLGDANSALFSVDVLTAEGSAGSSGSVRNPAFDGEIPGLQAVRVSSTAPGPSDRVVVEAIADEQRPFDSIAGMTVEGPDGTELNRSNITDGRASFTTNGSGEHRVELVLERNGNNFTEVVTIGARNTPVKRPPTIRPAEGVTGEFVIVSDGFESGDVEIRDAGAEVVVIGQIGEDADVPRRLHVHTQALDTAKTHATTVRVVRGENERLLQTRTTSVLHATAISEDGIIYRDEDQPIPRKGGNQFGEGEIDPVNGTTVETYSRADGVLVVELRNEPGRVAEVWYETKLQFPVLADPPVVGQVGPITPETPDLPLAPAGPMLLLGAGLLGRRWWA